MELKILYTDFQRKVPQRKTNDGISAAILIFSLFNALKRKLKLKSK